MITMTYLSNETLDVLLSVALRVARRLGCGCDAVGMWRGPRLPWSALALLQEYKVRYRRKP